MAFRKPRLPNDLTPEQREARIAELRARRHARMRKLAIRSALGSMALALVGAVLLYWLLATFGGRDFLLARIVGLLPAGTELTWSRAEGPVRGPLTMHDVRYVQRGCPDVDGEPVPYGRCATPTVLTFTARRITLTPEIAPLVGRRLRIGGAVLSVEVRIGRCLATATDPETGQRDADTLGALRAGWGAQEFGVYAEVVSGGRVALGDELGRRLA